MPSCKLDRDGLRLQRDRYRALARDVAAIDRRPGRLEARFGDGVNAALLDEAIAVERRCCPFFEIDYAPAERRLDVTVNNLELEPALDALRDALTA